MNQAFLPTYQKLSQDPVLGTGLWLLHGDEPLLPQWLIEKMQPAWREAGMPIHHMEITNAKSWQDIMGELNSLSLFDDSKVIIAQGNHKPDKTSLAELEQFTTQNSSNCLIVLLPKQDKKSQATAFFSLCEKFGQVIDCQLYQENQRQQILAQRAREFGLQLTAESWQLLLEQTQNNLLTAYQSLWRLSYLYALPPQPDLTIVTPEQLQAGLVSQSQFSTFDLADAMLAGELEKTLKILAHLKQAEEPESLVLWVIAKEMRNLQSLQAGANFQSLGIWQNKQSLYQQALRRLSPTDMQDWAKMLYRCDQAIKGLIKQPAWELLYQLALKVVGKQLFPPLANA